MNEKYLITLNDESERVQAIDIVERVVAEYPDSLLVECTPQQYADLVSAKIECDRAGDPAPSGRAANVMAARLNELEANVAAGFERQPQNPNRKAYFVVTFQGPIKGEWLQLLREAGVTRHGALPGNRMIIGMLPTQLNQLKSMPAIATVIPYAPSLKISAALSAQARRQLDATGLAAEAGSSEEEEVKAQAVEIAVFEGEGTAQISATIRENGGTVISETKEFIRAVVPQKAFGELATQEGIQSVAPYVLPELHNDVGKTIMQLSGPTGGIPGFTGAGQVIAIADSGLDTGDANNIHDDFAGRVSAIISFPVASANPYHVTPAGTNDGPADTNSGHGTHVAGSVLGSGAAAVQAHQQNSTTGPTPSGVATDATCYFQAVEQVVTWKTVAQLNAEGLTPFQAPWPPDPATLTGLPDDLADLFQPAYDAGARVHTNSWGANVAGRYTASSRQVDEFAWEHRDFIVLVSAGNAGADRDASGVIDSDSIGAPATAKNCVTVGATENQRPRGSTPPPGLDINWAQWRWPALNFAGHVSDDPDGMAAFSSRGPTDDGRLKPDVVAPGTNVLSAKTSMIGGSLLWGTMEGTDPLFDHYCWSGGTSMSCPLVAGAAALIRQYLIEQRGHHVDGVTPSGALIKALLINGAIPLSGQFPGEVPAGPNNVSGFGRVSIGNSVGQGPLGEMQFSDDPSLSVVTGSMRRFKTSANVPDEPVKITLCWTDAPGQVSAFAVGGFLRNKLRLQIRLADGTLINAESSPPTTANNNVQQVVVDGPGDAEFQIRVRGAEVTEHSPHTVRVNGSPAQDFALVVSNTNGLQPL